MSTGSNAAQEEMEVQERRVRPAPPKKHPAIDSFRTFLVRKLCDLARRDFFLLSHLRSIPAQQAAKPEIFFSAALLQQQQHRGDVSGEDRESNSKPGEHRQASSKCHGQGHVEMLRGAE